MSHYQVEEYYVFIKVESEKVGPVKDFIQSDKFEYSYMTSAWDDEGLTIDDFDSEMLAEDCDIKIREFIDSL